MSDNKGDEKMIIPFTDELIGEIVSCNSSGEVGIFISLLCKEYIKQHEVTEEQFFNSLKSSLEKLKSEEHIEKD